MENISSFWLWWQQNIAKKLLQDDDHCVASPLILTTVCKHLGSFAGIAGIILCKSVCYLYLCTSTEHNIIKDSENQEECLCTEDKSKGWNWMCVIFRTSGSTALKTGTILYWTSLHGVRNTSRNHCLWTQFTVQKWKCKLKLYHAKKKKCHYLLWAKAHLKWSEKWKTVLWSDESKYEILFGNYGCCPAVKRRGSIQFINSKLCICDGIELH